MTFKKGEQVVSKLSGNRYTVVHDDLDLDRVWVKRGSDNIVLRAEDLKKYVREIEVGDVVYSSKHPSLTDARFAYRIICMVPGYENHAVAVYAKSDYNTTRETPFIFDLSERDEWSIA